MGRGLPAAARPYIRNYILQQTVRVLILPNLGHPGQDGLAGTDSCEELAVLAVSKCEDLIGPCRPAGLKVPDRAVLKAQKDASIVVNGDRFFYSGYIGAYLYDLPAGEPSHQVQYVHADVYHGAAA